MSKLFDVYSTQQRLGYFDAFKSFDLDKQSISNITESDVVSFVLNDGITQLQLQRLKELFPDTWMDVLKTSMKLRGDTNGDTK